MGDSADWAGAGYSAGDKYTGLFNEITEAFRAINDYGSSRYCAGLIRAYSLVTGESYSVVYRQVADATRDLVVC